MKRALFVTAVLVFICVAVVFAETSVKAEVDKTSMTTDEALTYRLTISYSEANLSSLQLPKFEGFVAVSQIQSSSITFVKGGMKTSIIYSFVLAAKKTGKLKIEPAVIKVKNKTYSSQDFEIEVTQGEAKPEPEKPSYPEEVPLDTTAPQTIL